LNDCARFIDRRSPPVISEACPPLSAAVVGRGKARLLHVRDFEDEPGRRSAAKLLTKDEARLTAVNVAKLRSS
jgi:hypothetical protein